MINMQKFEKDIDEFIEKCKNNNEEIERLIFEASIEMLNYILETKEEDSSFDEVSTCENKIDELKDMYDKLMDITIPKMEKAQLLSTELFGKEDDDLKAAISDAYQLAEKMCNKCIELCDRLDELMFITCC